jgi:hypothetical protein
MSEARMALPSSRILAPSLIIGNTSRSKISSSPIERRAMPLPAECSTTSCSTIGDGLALRAAS